jgi:hypothetical protein
MNKETRLKLTANAASCGVVKIIAVMAAAQIIEPPAQK